jgi:hypothetical protein
VWSDLDGDASPERVSGEQGVLPGDAWDDAKKGWQFDSISWPSSNWSAFVAAWPHWAESAWTGSNWSGMAWNEPAWGSQNWSDDMWRAQNWSGSSWS